jgi:transcriptional regulator with XRE-family HTH domain
MEQPTLQNVNSVIHSAHSVDKLLQEIQIDTVFQGDEYEKVFEENPDFIAKTIVDIRKEKSLTQNEVALKAGLTQPQLSSIEKGKTPSFGTLFKICKALETDPIVFMFKALNEISITDPRNKVYTTEYLPSILKAVVETNRSISKTQKKNILAD